jgi:hypothetical protein
MKVCEIINDAGEVIGYAVRCPACTEIDMGFAHVFNLKRLDNTPAWSFNGDFEKPTFIPSMLSTAKYGDPADGQTCVCHSHVRDGFIQYLADCTHSMKNQTVELPDWDKESEDNK